MERLLVPIQLEAGWVAEEFWTGEDRNLFLLPGDQGTHEKLVTYSKE
jgi:hypothetical protein